MFRRTSNVHFVGIGGVGMSGIAEILLTLGYDITGSDIEEGARVRNLRRRGATVHIGHDPDHVQGSDVVVMTSAVDETNPEIREAHDRGIPVIPRAEMLAELMRLKEGIAIAGTHGKTTTTAMVSRVLQAGGSDPTVVVGGRLHNQSIGARLGTDDQIVVEADESDGSFLKLNPVMSVVTNIENEHLDFYGTMEELEDVFLEFINSVPFYGFTALCGDDPRVRDLLREVRKPFQTYGFGEENELRARRYRVVNGGARFSVLLADEPLGEVELKMPGRHNALNALGATSIGLEQGMSFDDIREGLGAFEGVARRFDHQGSVGQMRVVDDYAHHPTEIETTLTAANQNYDGELIVVFQPHRYSRTRDLAEEFGPAFDRADRLLVTDIYPAGEQPIEGVDLEYLKRSIQPHRNGHRTRFESDRDRILDWVENQLDPDRPQTVFTMGAGDVVNLAEPILDRARSLRRDAPS